MTRLLLVAGLLCGLAGCGGAPPSGRAPASSGATTRETGPTSGPAATPRTPAVRPDPG